MSKPYTEEELESWLEKIEDTHKKVKDILDGNVDIEQLSKQEEDEEKLKKTKEELKRREEREKLLKGRPGKGHQKGYVVFCRHCFTEFLIDLDKCTHCQHDTISYEDRMDELRGKLEEYKEKKRRKIERKSKWENWKKTQAMFYKKTSTNYKKWEFFDSESDSDKDDNSDPILPKEDAGFKAMEADMLDRRKKREREKKEANELKEKGNTALKKGCYKTAIKYYSDALELRKDLLPIYTNRALARLKLEDYEGVIDDCTKVLEYCEVFHDGFLKEKDLCYKALMRRCQALRGQKDYALALKDLESAQNLMPGDKDVNRFLKLTQEDIELEDRIKKIMSNSELLKGKEYLDFMLDFLQGKKDEQKEENKSKEGNAAKYCLHQIEKEQVEKLSETFSKDKDLVYYFNCKNGMKILVESLEYNQEALTLIQSLLEKDSKLQEDFQRQKQYEQLIDFIYKNNKNVEEKLLDPKIVHQILEILEEASMNEFVRENLAEKKKIKDLFMIVMKSIDISLNKKLISSLITFVSNLCYGNIKFKQMLRSENMNEFLSMIKKILQSNDTGNENEIDQNLDRILLKQATLGFLGNLITDSQIRQIVASNCEQLLEQICSQFARDSFERKVDWIENSKRELAILINCSVENQAQNLLIEKGLIKILEKLMSSIQYKGEEMELVNRSLNLLSKLCRHNKGAEQSANSKELVNKSLLYFSKVYPELIQNALRVFHAMCRTQEFRSICFEQHNLNTESFQNYIEEVKTLFLDGIQKQDWDLFINTCGSISAFSDVIPEKMGEFKDLIIPLIQITSQKVDQVRKMAAICLAKLSRDEENNKIMKANHGTEVLVSLGGVLAK